MAASLLCAAVREPRRRSAARQQRALYGLTPYPRRDPHSTELPAHTAEFCAA